MAWVRSVIRKPDMTKPLITSSGQNTDGSHIDSNTSIRMQPASWREGSITRSNSSRKAEAFLGCGSKLTMK